MHKVSRCIANPYLIPFLLHVYVSGLSHFLWLISAEPPTANVKCMWTQSFSLIW